MGDILLSLCISSYQRGDKCIQLVNKILSIQDNRYNIIICDDASDKDTINKLKTLSNPKIKLFLNKENLGACRNWFHTINHGNGKYMLHILDRDDIDINKLKLILNILEKNSVGAGYFGRSAMYPAHEMEKNETFSVCRKGREAFLTMAGVPIHPTGFFVENKEWREGQYQKYFYKTDRYGIYPHSYVLSNIAVKRDMIYSPISFCYIVYRSLNKKSRFYEKRNKKDYWWLPESVMKTSNRLLLFCCKLAEDSYKTEFVCRRFKDGLDRATISYKNSVENQEEMEHYGFHAHVVSNNELLKITIIYWVSFLFVLNKLKLPQKSAYSQLKGIWAASMKNIIQAKESKKDLEIMLGRLNHNLRSFRVMNQWVKMKQEGKNLSEYFELAGYKNIAIYGMGYIGETLLNELSESKTKVMYGIDQNADMIYSSIKIISMEEELQPVDAIVVTVANSFENIVEKLQKKISCPIISIVEVVYDI